MEQSDIVIAAAGVPGLVRAEWIREGAIVIDIGVSFVPVQGSEKKVLTGDIEFNELTLQRCAQITPVPGGVGPLTIAMLLQNTVESWEKRN